MKYIKLVFFVLIFTKPYKSIGQGFTFEENTVNKIEKKFSKILIIGYGSSASRFFLENLSERLIGKLKSIQIIADYKYAGNFFSFNKIIDSTYETYLIFSPSDTSKFKYSTSSSQNEITTQTFGSFTPSITSRSIFYHQNFNLFLYEKDNSQNKIWEATLKVDWDLRKKKLYDNISNKLIKSLHFKK